MGKGQIWGLLSVSADIIGQIGRLSVSADTTFSCIGRLLMILMSLFWFQLPQDPEDMKHWMYNLYVEKEKMLERYYQTGQFPYDMYPPASTSAAAASAASNLQSRAPKMLYHDPLKFVVLHLFFLASTVVMIWTFLSLKSWNLFSMPSW